MQERRQSPRTRTLRAGKILFNNKRSVIDCMVRNISASGACVLVANVVGIPATSRDRWGIRESPLRHGLARQQPARHRIPQLSASRPSSPR
jgi:hypothetical protein